MASYFCSLNYSRKISVSFLQKIFQDAVATLVYKAAL